MNSVGKTLAAVLATGLIAWQSCLAAESQTIRISCTIPAIPGVNAPMVEQVDRHAVQQTAYAQPKETLDPQEEQETQKPDDKTSGETIGKDDEGHTVIVRSFYSR
jgi:hypothetical protein